MGYFPNMTPRIRFIRDNANDAAFNMAADLWLLRQCPETGTVYVRLYGWAVPSVSLGFMQQPATVLDLDALQRTRGCWIRRPTGGRAVLHDGDLTYSVVFPHGIAEMGSSIMETYGIIADCLIAGLAKAGVVCQPHDSNLNAALVRGEAKLPCFLAPNRREIMVEGKKLIGSAQKRTADAVLQHGSIPITPAFRSLPSLSNDSETHRAQQRRLFNDKCTCVHEHVPDQNAEHLGDCLMEGFSQTLPLEATTVEWTSDERAQVESLSQSSSFRSTYAS